MEWKWKRQNKKQPELIDCAKTMKPSTFSKVSSIFKENFTGLPQGSFAPLSMEDIRAGGVRQLEVERMREMAIMYWRHNMIR